MTNSETATAQRFEPPGPGFWEFDPVHFPRPMTRYWTEVHPAAFKRGTGDFARFYGMLMDSLQSGYVNGFGFRKVVPVAEEEIPARFQRAAEVIAGEALARAASRLGRDGQAELDPRPPRAAVGRSRPALRRRAGRII